MLIRLFMASLKPDTNFTSILEVEMKKLLLLLMCLVMALVLTGAVFAGGGQEETKSTGGGSNLEASLALDAKAMALTAADGQPLLILAKETRAVPKRPADPEALPEDDPLHWYDLEFSGWDANKQNIPPSPKDGAIGKRVTLIVHGDHPWTTACSLGAQKVADAYQMKLKVLSPNWDLAVQNQMIDQTINERPDLMIIFALDAKTATQQARKINQAGIPLILTNMTVAREAHNYCISWTGPDDFGQFRMMSRAWADELVAKYGKSEKIGVAYVQHAPGGSPYFARYWGPRSELAGYAPNIVTLDAQAPGFEADKTMQLVSDWLTRFGKDLKGICAADDSAQALGIAEALKKAGREDVLLIAAGNSKVGMDAVKAGNIRYITYQTAEGDGALAVKTAADWFNGKKIEPVRNIPQKLIDKNNVDDFYPAQW
jgi:ribose transport system substrate-binding protein